MLPILTQLYDREKENGIGIGLKMEYFIYGLFGYEISKWYMCYPFSILTLLFQVTWAILFFIFCISVYSILQFPRASNFVTLKSWNCFSGWSVDYEKSIDWASDWTFIFLATFPQDEVTNSISELTIEPKPEEPSAEDERRKWEEGYIDYMGKDAFENIQKKLDSFLF